MRGFELDYANQQILVCKYFIINWYVGRNFIENNQSLCIGVAVGKHETLFTFFMAGISRLISLIPVLSIRTV